MGTADGLPRLFIGLGDGVEVAGFGGGVVDPFAQEGAAVDDVDGELAEFVFVGKVAPKLVVRVELADQVERAALLVAPWLLVVLGLLVLYVPTYRDLSAVFWARENGAPGAVVVGILTALFTQWVNHYGKVEEGASMGVVFTTLFALGLVALVLKRSGDSAEDVAKTLAGGG